MVSLFFLYLPVAILLNKLLNINFFTPNLTSKSQISPHIQGLLSTAIILGFHQNSKQNIEWTHNKKIYRISDYNYKNW